MPLHATIGLLLASAIALSGQHGARTSPIFLFHTDEMWLNLHHFLYVLGRHEAAFPDRTREAVVDAPKDAEKGLARMAPDAQRAWRDAVTFYAKGPSRQDILFDAPAVAVTLALTRARSTSQLDATGLDPDLASTLRTAAPLYLKTWWPAHLEANRAWAKSVEDTARQHGDAMLAFITRAYGLEWPATGYPVHVAGYANWAGAYSNTEEKLLVVSSLDPMAGALERLEITFHEAMHQWDAVIIAALRGHARALGTRIPDLLSHALIFYTAGEAARAVDPGHVTNAERNGIWRRRMGVYKADLDAVWKPYLQGKGTRDEAFAELVKRATRPAPRPPNL